MVRQKLTKNATITINALIVIDVHAKDVVANLVAENVRITYIISFRSPIVTLSNGFHSSDITGKMTIVLLSAYKQISLMVMNISVTHSDL